MKKAWTTTNYLWLTGNDEDPIFLGASCGVDEIDIDRGLTIKALMPCPPSLLDAQNGCRFEIHDSFNSSDPTQYDENDIMMIFSNCRFTKRYIPTGIALSLYDVELMDILIEVDADVEIRSPVE